jgi:AMP phosphorylase
MREIIEAQGGDPRTKADDVEIGQYSEKISSPAAGYVTHISNKAIVQVARAAGAPKDKGAGIFLHITKGTKVERGTPLFDIYAESEYKLEQAVKQAKQFTPVQLEGMLLRKIPEYTFFGER